MLSGIKEKILSVKKNVSLFGAEEKNVSSPETQKINFSAGAEILEHFQQEWVQIHQTNEENAQLAEIISETIQKISTKSTSDRENLGLITHVLTNSNLCSNVTNCLKQVRELHCTCSKIEEGIIMIENLIDEVEFQNRQKQHRKLLEEYRKRKEEELEAYKQTLAENHKQKLLEQEANKVKVLEERQKVFQEAFKMDLELYKHSGEIPRVDLPKRQNGALLEEIQLEFDQSELDHFFNEN